MHKKILLMKIKRHFGAWFMLSKTKNAKTFAVPYFHPCEQRSTERSRRVNIPGKICFACPVSADNVTVGVCCWTLKLAADQR